MWTIYRHIFPNGKSYIGQTKIELHKRFQNGEGYKGCPLIYRAIQKYGWTSVQTEIIKDNISSLEEANLLEEYYINYYDTQNPNVGYNIAPGGGVINKINEQQQKQIYIEWNNNLGVKEIATKLNINRNTVAYYLEQFGISIQERLQRVNSSISHSLRKIDRTSIYNEWLNHPDYKFLEEKFNCSRDTIRRALEEHNVSVHERTVSQHQKLKSSPNGYNKKSINQYDLNGNFIKTFDSIADANRALNKAPNASCITSVCKGRRKTAYGFKWAYNI